MTLTQQNTAAITCLSLPTWLLNFPRVALAMRGLFDRRNAPLTAWVKAVAAVSLQLPAAITSRLALPNSNCGRGLFWQVAA